MKGRKARKKGVSLVELILSIAVLSLLSIYVIQMFIISHRLNQEAEALDQSVVLAARIFEQIEAAQNFEDFLETPLLTQAVTVVNNTITEVNLFYDESWQGVMQTDGYHYSVFLTHERVPTLDYQIDYYKLTVNQMDQSNGEQIYELEMQKYN